MKKAIVILTILFILQIFSVVYANDSDVLNAVKAKFKIFINDKEFTPSNPAVVIDGRTYLPLRSISESLGININWNDQLNQVEIQNNTHLNQSEIDQNKFSFDLPDEIGNSQIIDYDDNGIIKKLTITFKNMSRGSEALDFINENVTNMKGQWDDMPNSTNREKLYEFLVVNVNVKLLVVKKDISFDCNKELFSLVKSDFKIYDRDYLLSDFYPILVNKFEEKLLYEGDESNGYIAFVVRKDDIKPRLAFGKNIYKKTGIWFKAYK